MRDKNKPKDKLINELAGLRQRIAELEASGIELKRVKEKLKESEEKYRDIVELAPDGIVTTDLKGMVTSCNEALLERTGYSRDKFINKHFSKIPTVHVRDIPKYVKVINSLIRGKVPRPFEYKWTHKDGTIHVGEVYISLIKKRGKIVGFQAITREITERKRVEEALRVKEAAISASQNAIGITDLEGSLIYVNESFLRLYGYDDESEVLGRPGKDFWIPVEEAQKAIMELRKKGKWKGELVALKKDGSLVDVLLSANVVTDEIGRPLCMMASGMDITDRKKKENVQAVIYRISEAAHSVENLEELYRSIHNGVSELMSAKNNFYIALYDEASELLDFPYFVDEYEGNPGPQKLRKGLTEYVLRTGKPLLAPPDVFKELEKKGEVNSVGPPSIDWLGVPLKTDDKTIGVMAIQSYTEGIRYKEEDKNILMFVSEQVVMAIERKKAEEMLQKAHDELELRVEERTTQLKTINEQLIRKINEQKQAEEALLKSEENLKTIMESVNDVIFQLSPLGFIEYVSPNVRRLYGYKPEELIGKHFKKTTPISELPKAFDALKTVLSGKSIKNFKIKQVDNKGKIIHMEINISPVRKEDKVIAGLGIMRNISQRERVEEELRESEERYRNIIELAPEGIITLDLKGVVTSCNTAFMRNVGFSKDEIIGKHFSKLPTIRARDILKYTKLFTSMLRGKLSSPLEFTWIHKDGSSNFGEIFASLLKRRGKIVGIQAIVIDITERKRAEEALRIKDAAIASSANGIAINDLEGRHVYVNNAFLKIMGYKSDKEILGKLLIEFVPGEYKDKVSEIMKEVQNKGSWSGEITAKRRDGSLFYVQLTANLIKDDLGKPIYTMASFIDITEHKKAEEELLKTKEEAETASRAKSDFLASMSHELRTPLNAIIGFSEMLQEEYYGKLNEKQSEYVVDILESGKHLLSLIDDTLDLSKIEAGKIELELSRVNIKELLEESLILIKEKCLKHRVSLDLRISQELTEVEIAADERKLRQLLFNLLSNAEKFTPDGGTIELKARQKGGELIISVSDTGIGIAPEHQERIFEEFYQVKDALRDRKAGTGLGLSLVKQFVEMHGGRIWVESEGEGKGSRFSFVLPMEYWFLEQGEPEGEKDRVRIEVTTEGFFLSHLNKFIYLSKLSNTPFTLCRLRIKPKPSKEKASKIKEALGKEKRAQDFSKMDKDGNIDLILKDADSKKAVAIYSRLSMKIGRVFDDLNVSCSMATFPEDGKTLGTLIKKLMKKND